MSWADGLTVKRHSKLSFGMGILCGGLLGFVVGSGLARLPAGSLPTVTFADAVEGITQSSTAVLVIDVRDRERAAAVRAAVADERVVAESSHGFALRERRLVVASLENAGGLLEAAGWEDAGLQILRFAPLRHRELEKTKERADAARLAELMQKPTLTYFEAQQALALL